jgi:hypothetical protein
MELMDPQARVFFAPTSLRAGRSWTRALAEETNRAVAAV